MAFEPDFLELMPHTVTIERFTGFSTDGFATPVYAAARSFRCRIAGKGLSLRQRTGEQDDTVIFDIWIGAEVVAGVLVDASAVPFTMQDLITLPAGSEWIDQTPIVFAVDRNTDDTGHHHTKIQCGWIYHRQTAS